MSACAASPALWHKPWSEEGGVFFFGFDPVPATVSGSEAVNRVLADVLGGLLSREAALRWVAELQREGFDELVPEIESRLPALR